MPTKNEGEVFIGVPPVFPFGLLNALSLYPCFGIRVVELLVCKVPRRLLKFGSEAHHTAFHQ